MAPKKAAKRKRYRNPSFLKALGMNCKKLRIQKGYSIDRLSKEGELLSPAVIHRLESGISDVQVSVLLRIAQVLEIPIKKLLDLNFEHSKE